MSNRPSQELSVNTSNTLAGQAIEARGKTLIPLMSQKPSSGFWSQFNLFQTSSNQPLGFLVVGDRKTQFIKVQERRWLLLGLLIGLLSLILLFAGISWRAQKPKARKPALW